MIQLLNILLIIFAFLLGLFLNRNLAILINNSKFFLLKKDLKKIFETLDYSVENNLLHFTKKLVINFANNQIRFEGFYKPLDDKTCSQGICGDLVLMVYNRIKPKYHDDFKIRAVVGHDPDFFYKDTLSEFTHIFLTLEKKDGKEFIIDPTFKRIVSKENYAYEVIGDAKPLNLIMYPDLKMELSFKKGVSFPIKFVGNYLILLTLIMVNEYEFKIELQSKRKGFRYFNSLFVVKYNHNSVSVNDRIGSIKKRTDKSPVINQDVALIKKKLLKLVKNVEIRTK